MITQINKIKNLGLFANYVPISSLKDFKKYNLVYGWNGTGKTTLTKLLDALESGTHADYPDLEFEISDDTPKKHVHGQPYNRKIRVFNQDYVEKNIQIREGKAKSITLTLGSASKEILEENEKLEKNLFSKNSKIEKERGELTNKETTKGKAFSAIASTILVAITGVATRTYRKNNAEEDFAILSSKAVLSDEEVASLTLSVKQQPKPSIVPIENPKIILNGEEETVTIEKELSDICREAKEIFPQKVESIVIERLKTNPDIAVWIESGHALHTKHSSKNCEFCGQKIPEARLSELTKHFNDADRLLKEKVDLLVSRIELVKTTIKISTNLPDSARFYDELSELYKKELSGFTESENDLLVVLEKIRSALLEKKSKTTESMNFKADVDPKPYLDLLTLTNGVIQAHNKKTSDFESARLAAMAKIKNHYLSTIYDDVKSLESDVQKHNSQINKLTNGDPAISGDMGVVQIADKISENLTKISSTHKACADITQALNTFLGRNELVFEPHKRTVQDKGGKPTEVDDGYIIKRNGKVVTHLSEGEKTAIAFVYFTIHLNDPSFDKEKDIVVIDDPVSSLDSNSIFQAFSFLKNSVKDIHQVFMLTHNFDFLRLILNWLTYPGIKKDVSFYMVKNKDEASGRIAYLDELDKDLQDHESEYNYLFKILFNFQSDGTIASVYHMPNVARKVLDSFLMFRVPNNASPYQKLESLKSKFDENKLAAIYKFTNDQSHITGKGFDPSLVPETQKVVKYLLEFIEATFPEHYSVLVAS